MSFAKHLDRFDRVDGPIGSDYTVVCGQVEIFDEAVWPVEVITTGSPDTINRNSLFKVQALLTKSTLDGSNYAVRGVWAHVKELPGIEPISQLLIQANQDPSFTLLARMTKDPLLVDLERTRVGGSARSYEFDPACYDQGYGLRVTCPRNGAAPILKIIKFSPPVVGPGVSGPQTLTEVDKARVLTQVTLLANQLHLENDEDISTYRGQVQSMRLRVRRSDDHVILEAFLNERNQHTPILTYTDRAEPLWGATGLPGIEFLQAVLVSQPTGTSPFSQRGIPVMECQLFECETIKDRSPATVTEPDNYETYQRVAERVALLVEKDGDTDWTATARARARLDTYLGFVYETERDILRKEGYWKFLERTVTFFIVENQAEYELPENVELIYNIQRVTGPTRSMSTRLQSEYRDYIPNPAETSSIPQISVLWGVGVNDRPLVRFASTPNAQAAGVEVAVDYYARWIHPHEPEREIPLIPQNEMDVLVYGAAAHAGPYATSATKVVQWNEIYGKKLQDLVRWNNRKMRRRTILRHVSDVPDPSLHSLYPLTRAAQLSQNFFLR